MYILNRLLFILSHEIMYLGFYKLYQQLLRNQWNAFSHLRNQQNRALKEIIRYSYDNIPFYKVHFDETGVKPREINRVEDLVNIPPITKEDILKNKDLFETSLAYHKHYIRNTGGTTGTPLRYRISHVDRFLQAGLLYRGWSAAGYKLGDKMLFLAGSSLIPNMSSKIRTAIHELTRNIKFYSSFNMSQKKLSSILSKIHTWKPKFIRGYPSAINEFAKYIDNKDEATPELHAIFTTSEKLFDRMRQKIEEAFHASVFDAYGANDGGISTFECEHGNIHVDMERSVLEVVDEKNKQIDEGRGSVIATSLHNYAMPFIRYKIGDEVIASKNRCDCGRGLPLLKEVIGRSVSILLTPDGAKIHGWFFLYLFWEIGEAIKQYKVVQKTLYEIDIFIIPGKTFTQDVIDYIRNVVHKKCPGWNLRFLIVEDIPRPSSGKLIFIDSHVI